MSEEPTTENSNFASRLRAWHAGLAPLGRQRLYVAVGLGLLLLALLAFLRFADDPWEGKAPKLLERTQRPEGTRGHLRNLPTEYWIQVLGFLEEHGV